MALPIEQLILHHVTEAHKAFDNDPMQIDMINARTSFIDVLVKVARDFPALGVEIDFSKPPPKKLVDAFEQFDSDE